MSILCSWVSPRKYGHRHGFLLSVFLVVILFLFFIEFTERSYFNEVLSDVRALFKHDRIYFPTVPGHVHTLFQSRPPPIRPTKAATDSRWQPVTNTSDAYVYSAYFERRFSERIRIVGVIRSAMFTRLDLYCILWYDDVLNRRPSLVAARVMDMKADHTSFSMANAFFLCAVEETGADQRSQFAVPTAVSVVHRHTLHRPLNVVVVHKKILNTPRYNLTACLSPLHNPKIKKGLIEWIETNKLLGVELFTVYVHRISNSNLRVLKYYESKKIVEIVNWTMDTSKDEQFDRPSAEHISYFGQGAALNDCVYRNKGRTRLLMQTDLDELILPEKLEDFTLLDMIRRLPTKDAYSFRHTCHPRSKRSVHPAVREYTFDVRMVDHFERSTRIWNSGSRSKIICNPDKVVLIGVHLVFKPRWFFQHVVDTDIGMLHHYRNPDDIPDRHVPTVTTRVTEKYLATVLQNMNITIADLQMLIT